MNCFNNFRGLQDSSPNYNRVYDYEHSYVARDSPENMHGAALRATGREESTNSSDDVILRQHQPEEATLLPGAVTGLLDQPLLPSSSSSQSVKVMDGNARQVGHVQFWKTLASSTCSGFQEKMKSTANGTLTQARSWLRSIRTKVECIGRASWLAQQLSGQRWVVEISVHNVTPKGLQVLDITEVEFGSKEHAEWFATQWEQQVVLEGSRINPYEIKIYLKNIGESKSTKTDVAPAPANPMRYQVIKNAQGGESAELN